VASERAPESEATIDAALFLFDRIPAEEILPVEPATTFPEDALRGLLQHMRYVSLELPEARRAVYEHEGGAPEFLTERSLRRLADGVAQPEVQARLSGVLRFMTTWHALAGEPEAAALAAGLAAGVERDFRRSPLVRQALLEARDRLRDPRPMRPGDFVEVGVARGRLRDAFFADVAEPRMHDVARLDLTEVAYWALDLAFEHAPPGPTWAEGGHERLSYLLASMFLDHGKGPMLRSIRRERRLPLLDEMTRIVATELDLPPEPARTLAESIEDELGAFHAQVCGRCPFFCDHNKDEPAEDLLELDLHPADVDEP
jgi:hypothetical protein